jgi:mevalonate kinase
MDEQRYVVSAPGKVILFGEHSVVYKKPAVAASLSQRFFVAVCSADDSKITLSFDDLQVRHSWPTEQVHAIIDSVRHSSKDSDTGQSKIQFNPALFEQIENSLCFDFDNPSGNAAESKSEELISNATESKSDERSKETLSLMAFIYMYVAVMSAVASDEQLERARRTGIRCSMASKVPIGAGLGSSAAFSVSLVTALLAMCSGGNWQALGDVDATTGDVRPRDSVLGDVNRHAFALETLIHGTPSGIDNSCSTFGGAIKFVRGEPLETMRRVPPLELLITNTQVPRSTKTIVAGVRRRLDDEPECMQPLLDRMGDVADRWIRYLADYQDTSSEQQSSVGAAAELFAQLVDDNQALLRDIGVSHPAIESVIDTTRERFNLHTKLTGAGGGGCTITLVPDSSHIDTLIEALAPLPSFRTKIGGVGVLIHTEPASLLERADLNLPLSIKSLFG